MSVAREPSPAAPTPAEPVVDGPPRRRFDDPPEDVPMVRWPLDIDDAHDIRQPRDPWTALVRSAMEAYRTGRQDRLREVWDPEIVWRVEGRTPPSGEYVGPDAITAYHLDLARRTDGSFRQRLIAVAASGGPIVEAHLRTFAERRGQRLDIPTLLVFEIGGARLRRLTEIPGDRAAWDAFWTA
jgi:ketosteroid isomerase-like protein